MTDCPEMCEALRASLPSMPLFPLGSSVFFPHTLLPLHIFEPRYREMTEHAIEGNKILAVVQCDNEERLAPVAGAGRIVHHERLPDGRFHILLQGLARIEIEDELPAEELLYRRARTRLLEPVVDERVEVELAALRACYDQLALQDQSARDTLGDLVQRIQDAGVLADVACATALSDPKARQAALEETRISHRLRMATGALADLILQSAPTADVVH